MESAPKVSVIIPAYNMARYVGETISSAQAQSFTDHEIIVINDGSTDETEQALEPFRDQIVYVRQKNRGLSAARNTGLRLARGAYVALLDADDLLLPAYLEKMVGLMESASAPDVVWPNAILFGQPHWEGKLFQDIYPASHPVTVERLLAKECNIFVSAIFHRRLIAEVGMFDEEIRWGGEDFDLWLRMVRRGYRFDFTTEPLVRYRKRSDSLSGRDEGHYPSLLYIGEKLLAEADKSPGEIRLIEQMVADAQARINRARARHLILNRDFDGAASHLALANSHFRSLKLTLVGAALKVAPELVVKAMQWRQRQDSNTN
jgi:glycosyltransferase involved in cell wall biosynthesis